MPRAPLLRALLLVLACALAPLSPALAQGEGRVTLGWGTVFANDALGDMADRWQTGAYTVSRVRGPSWGGRLPATFGEILEFRGRGQVIAPVDLTRNRANDRRYAGILSFGVHTHFDLRGWETSVGLDLVATGPQTRVGEFQSAVHDLLGLPEPRVLNRQIPDGVHPTLVAEAGRTYALGPRARLRPFVEVQAGAEDFLRAGGDLILGHYGEGGLLLREQVTGHRYLGVTGTDAPGLSFVLGADVAHVGGSIYLPEGAPRVTLRDTRERVRLGVNWQGERHALFYGVTWLGREFEQQSSGQMVGALNLKLSF